MSTAFWTPCLIHLALNFNLPCTLWKILIKSNLKEDEQDITPILSKLIKNWTNLFKMLNFFFQYAKFSRRKGSERATALNWKNRNMLFLFQNSFMNVLGCKDGKE